MKTDFNSRDVPFAAALPGRQPVQLAELGPGACATVVRVESESGIGRRLLDLGFIPGTPLRVIRRAPLGDPVSYEVRGTRMCLRRSEALRIWVDAEPSQRAGS
jgi:Fe2+ transport system protein FeoA